MVEAPTIASLTWILLMGLAMSVLALSGSLTLLLPERVLRRALFPVVALAAGSLLGGALFHMLPHAVASAPHGSIAPWVWAAVGFAAFMALDQLLEWHHCHRTPSEHTAPLNWLILAADGLHNLLGGLGVGAVFVIDVEAGLVAWLAAAAHEVPQEIGDFGVLVHGGWTPRRALAWNLLSALTFPLGGVVAWLIGGAVDVGFLVAIGAGSFVYIAAADLIPEVKRSPRIAHTLERFLAFLLGAGLLLAVHLLMMA